MLGEFFGTFILILLGDGVVAGVLLMASPVMAQTAPRTPAPNAPAITAADLSRSLEGTAQTVSPSVVEIFTTSFTPREGIVARTGDLVATERASGDQVAPRTPSKTSGAASSGCSTRVR